MGHGPDASRGDDDLRRPARWRPGVADHLAPRRTRGPDSLATDGIVVISLWRANLCVGSFRLEAHEVPDLIHALTKGLAPADGGSLSDTP